MKDLIDLIQASKASFSSNPLSFQQKVEQINTIKSYDDLLQFNGLERIKTRGHQLAFNEDVKKQVLEKVIGDNNLMHISFFKKGLDITKTVGRIVQLEDGYKRGLGTGFMVGPGLLMTNNHVLETTYDAKQLKVEFDYEQDEKGQLKPTFLFRFDPQTFFITDTQLDYTIVAVEPVAMNEPDKKLEDYGWTQLKPSSDHIFIGEPVSIIQHPKGSPKMIAIRENKVVEIIPPYIHYTTDTQSGSSGSFVANDQWEIIALHRSGVPDMDKSGNVLLEKGGIYRDESDFPFIRYIANQGVMIDDILKDINTKPLSNPNAQTLKQELLKVYLLESAEKEYKLPGR